MREKLLKTVATFTKDRRGNFAIMSALMAPLIVVAAGGAVDYSSFVEVNKVAQRSLDSASLAVASGVSRGEILPSDAKQRASEIFFLNMAAYGVTGVGQPGAVSVAAFEIDFDENASTVEVSANLMRQNSFTRLIGLDEFKTNLTSTSAFLGAPGAATNIEFSFVVDVTGSMAQNGRMDGLRSALRSSLNVLLPATGANDERVRVGLVPYAYSVNLGRDFHRSAVGTSTASASSRNTCVTEREGTNAFTRVRPRSTTANTLYETDAALRPYTSGACPEVVIRPLTNDREALLRDVDQLRPSGATAGHIGIDWGLNLLAEEWQDFWPAASRPFDYDEDDTRKVLVIMTDGEFNTAYYDRNTRGDINRAIRQTTDSRNAALQFCDLAKATSRDVEVYTIAFQAGREAEDLLRSCATPDDPSGDDSAKHFFDASSNEELVAAFRSIVARELKIQLIN